MEDTQIETKVERIEDQRQLWHKPEIQRLAVSLDTKIDVNSGTDGEFQTNTII